VRSLLSRVSALLALDLVKIDEGAERDGDKRQNSS